MRKLLALVSVSVLASLAGAELVDAQVPPYPPSPPPIVIDQSSVLPGQQIRVTVNGCQPGEAVTFTLNPGGIVLGTVTADATGSATLVAAIPVGLAAGSYTVTATCGAVVRTIAVNVLSAAAAASPLVRTGSDSALPLARIAMAALAVGCLLVVLTARRRAAASAAV